MDKIEVTTRFDIHGKIIPLSFLWQGRLYQVASIGRSWQVEEEHHILVMDLRNRAFHLVFKPRIAQWYLLHSGDIPTLPRV